ncbi:hypothetical protein M422DRAFT_251443 [Sphaerobolus stellatus SS14]|uniref:Uncharacterized protein n=1 Tax=Sphaerobolus stellatus (strain SS14) TaxID=990650 RepID=A0A0C9W2K4_SPHS4|nr:hypothetical protein M422DRAFT_251443 [Sphaerobolus stellatus SS14]
MPERLHTPIPPLIDPILHEDPRLRFETFEYHPSYPSNMSYPVPDRTDAAIAMRHLWQPIVDSYWNTVRDWIAAKTKEREEMIVRKEKREAEQKAKREAEQKAERERLQRIKDQERDERVVKKLVEKKRKQLEKDVGEPASKKKKHPQTPKLAPTVVESDGEGEDKDREAEIVAVNRKLLTDKGIAIVEEDSLAVVHTSSKFSGVPRDEPCNRCRYWVELRGCATWICRDVGRKACATCHASNVSCQTTGEAVGRPKKGEDTPKRRASGSKANNQDRPEIFDHLGFLEANLEQIKTSVQELRDLARVQVMSQLLTYCLFEASQKVKPPGFQEQREEYRRSASKIFGRDHLGEVTSGPIEDGDEEDASGEEESEIGQTDATLGRDDDMVKDGEVAPGDMESNEESEEGSETKGERMTLKVKTVGLSTMESEESEETLEITSGEEEGSGSESEETGNYLPVKGKKSGKKATKN